MRREELNASGLQRPRAVHSTISFQFLAVMNLIGLVVATITSDEPAPKDSA
jgi:hypothetical protein